MAFAPSPAEAPSQFAWSVYQWAKGSASRTDKFYSIYVRHLLRTALNKKQEEPFDPLAGVTIGPEKVGRRHEPLKLPDAPGSGRESSEVDVETEAPAGQ